VVPDLFSRTVGLPWAQRRALLLSHLGEALPVDEFQATWVRHFWLIAETRLSLRRRSIDTFPPRVPRIPQAFDNGRSIPKTGCSRRVFSLAAGGDAPRAVIGRHALARRRYHLLRHRHDEHQRRRPVRAQGWHALPGALARSRGAPDLCWASKADVPWPGLIVFTWEGPWKETRVKRPSAGPRV
jgi:hypothetical protein